MSDILLEVDDELRSQQIKALWQRYGQTVIGIAVAVVIGTAIGTFWHEHTNKKLEGQTSHLMAILQENPDHPDIKALQKLYQESSMPLKSIVALHLAEEQERANDLKSARATYLDMANETRANAIVKDLAQLQAVRLGLALHDKPDTLLAEIEPLTKDNRPFHPSALELKGLLLNEQGKTAEANKVFQILADDAAAPNTLRQRAQSLIDYESKNAQQ